MDIRTLVSKIVSGVAAGAVVFGLGGCTTGAETAARGGVSDILSEEGQQKIHWRYFSTDEIDTNGNGKRDQDEPLHEKRIFSTDEKFYIGMRIRNAEGIKSTYTIIDSEGNVVFSDPSTITSNSFTHWCVYQPGEASPGKYSVEWYLEKGSERKLATIQTFEVVENIELLE